MKTLNTYISEKLKIDKNVHSNNLSNYFVYVDGFTKKDVEDIQRNCFMTVRDSEGYTQGWIVGLDNIPDLNINKIEVYRIPDNYRKLNDFAEAIITKKITTGKMHRYSGPELYDILHGKK